MPQFTVRRFEPKDAQAVYNVISITTHTTNSKVYEMHYIDRFMEWVTPEKLIERASLTHFYVICDGENVVCSGAIGPHLGREDESELLNIYILPEYQGKGLGKMILETLEGDEYFLRAKRIVLYSSLNAVKFYRKFGYDHVGGEITIGEEENYPMEKFR